MMAEETQDKGTEKVKRITKSDLNKVAAKLKEELEARKRNDFRRTHESMWKEVDRQINMQPMLGINRDGSEPNGDWHNAIELGELGQASENITSHVKRIVFPNARYWFDVHSDITDVFEAIQMPQPESQDQMAGVQMQPQTMNPQMQQMQQMQMAQKNAMQKRQQKDQEKVDNRVRAFMMQQHLDFGLKERCELSIKETLHHGSFVAEIRWETQEFVVGGSKIKVKGAPVWVPHSMWNCYPDPSPQIIGANTFYDGSMFIESYMKRHQAEELVKSGEEGWFASQWAKVNKDEHVIKQGDNEAKIKDVKIVTYWGDIVVPRTEGDLLYPNHKCVMMNGTIVYLNPNPTPYPPIIYSGYERTDVRDPYYISPIIKQSPLQAVASVLVNKYLDGIALALEPPIVYDGNDPDFVINGGPEIAPGSKVSTKGSNAFQQIKIGDPAAALQGLQLCLTEMKEKLGRPGADIGDRATKAEVVKSEQDQEVGIVGFIDKFENALRSYLYMQHSMNVEKLENYEFYSPEMQDPDFIRLDKKDLPKDANFEVVGARGVLGEQERSQKMSVVTAFASGNQLFAPLLDAKTILLQMYQDAGVKNAERFLNDGSNINPGQAMAMIKQLQMTVQKLGGMLQQEKQKSAVKMAKIQSDHQTKTAKMQSDHADRVMKVMADYDAKLKKLEVDTHTNIMGLLEERMKRFEDVYTKQMESNKLTKGLNNAEA